MEVTSSTVYASGEGAQIVELFFVTMRNRDYLTAALMMTAVWVGLMYLGFYS